MLRDKDFYDERQLQIHGKIFQRSFEFTVIALVVNGILNMYGIMWTSVEWQSIMIVVLAFTLWSMQCIIRGVVIGKNNKRNLIVTGIVIAVCGTAGFFLGRNAPSRGGGSGEFAFIRDNMLTHEGAMVIALSLFALIGITGLVKFIYIKTKKE